MDRDGRPRTPSRLVDATRHPARHGLRRPRAADRATAPRRAPRSAWSRARRRSRCCAAAATSPTTTCATSRPTCCATGSCSPTTRWPTASRPTSCSIACSTRSQPSAPLPPRGGRVTRERLAPPAARQGPGALPEDAVARIELALQRRLAGVLPGEHRAAGAATGIELVQLRPYEPGDDVRRLDPAASARTGVPHVRLQVPERALITWLVVRRLARRWPSARGSGSRATSPRAWPRSSPGWRPARRARRGRARRRRRRGRPAPGAAGAPRWPPCAGSCAPASPPTARGGTGAPRRDAAPRRRAGPHPRGSWSSSSDFRDRRLDRARCARSPRATRSLGVEVSDPREDALPTAGLLVVVDPETGALVEVDTADPRVAGRLRRGRGGPARGRRDGAAPRRRQARHLLLTGPATGCATSAGRRPRR